MSDPYIGEIRAFPYNFAPRGWILCDGTELEISGNHDLFYIIGELYGGNGHSTFRIPNFAPVIDGDVVFSGAMGQGQGPGLSNRHIGKFGGEPVVSLSENTMAAHNHALMADQEVGTTNDPVNNFIAGHPSAYSMEPVNPDSTLDQKSLASSGGGQPHNNRQPYLQMNYFIAASGGFLSDTE